MIGRGTGYAMRLGAMLLLLWSAGCSRDEDGSPLAEPGYTLEIPAGFPAPSIPADNALTRPRVELGKRLFYDPMLSRDSSISCASCHLQDLAFTDGKPLSEGVEGRHGFRNAPPLFNLAYHDKFFYDGGVPTLELQVLAPIKDHNEMDMDLRELTVRLAQDPYYPALFREAYGRDPDPYALIRAIAAFERTLISGNSRYDQYAFQGQTDALSAEEIAGMDLFFSEKTDCAHCHSGFNFTSLQFENVGLYTTYADSGRARVTLDPADRGRFKVPSLRNVALTAPYMHDGSIATLEEVVDHFNSGGLAHPNQSPHVRPLYLSDNEKASLLAFLHSLTDEAFVHNPEFSR